MLSSIRCGVEYLNLEVNSLGAAGIEALCSLGFNNVVRTVNLASMGILEEESLRAVKALGGCSLQSKAAPSSRLQQTQ